MKEFVEFRIIMEYAHLLFRDDEGTNLGDSVKVVRIDKNDPRFNAIGELQKKARENNDLFFTCFDYRRSYTETEINNAKWFQIFQTRHFEPAGEECGTIYDESSACPICGSGAKQLSPLRLRRSSIPKADMAVTIAWGDETIVSERFVKMVKDNKLKGLDFEPVISSANSGQKLNYYQVRPQYYLDFSEKSVFGQDPFNLSGEFPGCTMECVQPDGTIVKEVFPPEIYKCPNGDNMGLCLLSEAYIKSDSVLKDLDFFASRQTVGGRGGLIRQHHLFFCSNRMMKLIKDNNLKGFKFEVAHIVDE